MRLFENINDSYMKIRHAVKASHTGTGVGSMAAFVAASQIYSRFGIYGAAYLGLSIQLVKVITNVSIDWILDLPAIKKTTPQ